MSPRVAKLTSSTLLSATRTSWLVSSLVTWCVVVTPLYANSNDFVWNDPTIIPEPVKPLHLSYVRDIFKRSTITDWQLEKDLARHVGADDPPDGVKYGRVDVLTTVCFSGGFIDNLRNLDQPYSITSSAAWNEVAWGILHPDGKDPARHSFGSAWTFVPTADPNALPGMRELAHNARATNVAGPVFTDWEPSAIQHPQYESADDQHGGVNDLSTLKHNPGGAEQYAILIASSEREFDFDVELARMYQKLTDPKVYGLPPSHIAVLYADGSKPGADFIDPPDIVIPGTTALPVVPIHAPNSRKFWLKALKGDYFTGGAVPDADDKLFVYNTGHGGHGVYEKQRFIQLGENAVQYFLNVGKYSPEFEAQAGETLSAGPASYKPGMIGDLDLDKTVHLQLHMKEQVLFGPGAAQLLVNGMNVTNGVEQLFYPAEPDDPNNRILFLPSSGPGIQASRADFVYEVSLPLDSDSPPILVGDPEVMIEILNNPIPFPFPDILLAANFQSGQQEFVIINVPEPNTLALVSLAGFLLAGGRHRCRFKP